MYRIFKVIASLLINYGLIDLWEISMGNPFLWLARKDLEVQLQFYGWLSIGLSVLSYNVLDNHLGIWAGVPFSLFLVAGISLLSTRHELMKGVRRNRSRGGAANVFAKGRAAQQFSSDIRSLGKLMSGNFGEGRTRKRRKKW
jgi:hypothetical protein